VHKYTRCINAVNGSY